MQTRLCCPDKRSGAGYNPEAGVWPTHGFLGIPSGYTPVSASLAFGIEEGRAGLAEFFLCTGSVLAREATQEGNDPMGKKVKAAFSRLKAGNFVIPSPMEVREAMTPAGAWTALTLANWGISWPPEHGWREDLRRKWLHANQPFAPDLDVPCDDTAVMRLWRDCDLPEYFLGNGGTNHKLVEFARRAKELA